MLFSVAISWLMQIAKRAAQRFDLPFIFNLLAIGEFERIQHFLHVKERATQFFGDAVDLFDGLGDAGMLLRRWQWFLGGFQDET